MRKLLQFTFLSVLLSMFSLSVVGQTTVEFNATSDKGSITSNGTGADDTMTKDGITITTQRENDSGGSVFGNGKTYRIYGNTTLIITSTVGDITGFSFTGSSKTWGNPSAGSWNNSTKTWSANGESVTTVTLKNATSSQDNPTKITVTIGGAKADPGLAFSASSYNIQFLNTGSFAATSTANPASTGAITYSWDASSLPNGTTAVYNSGTRKVDVTAGETEGSFTLTANIAETDSHAAGTATTTIRIIDTRKDPNLKWSANTATTVYGEEFTAPTLSHKSDASPTFESSDPTVATIDASGVVTVVGAGTTTITASLARTDTYKAATASYTLTVTDPIVITSDGKYALVHDASTLSVGDEIIIVATQYNVAMTAADGTSSGNNRGKVDVMIANNGVNAPEEALVLTLEHSTTEGEWYLKSGANYLSMINTSENTLTVTDEPNLASVAITIDDNTGNAIMAFARSGRYIRYNNSSKIFACYRSTSTGMIPVQIFRKCKTIQETRALTSDLYSTMLLENTVVLNNYVDGEGCHVFVRDAKKANHAIEVLIPNVTSAPSWVKTGNILSGHIEGKRQLTADGSSVDRILYSGYTAATESGGDISPIILSDLTDIADYSGNSVVLIDQACTNDGTTCTIGGLTASTVFKGYTLPYEGAYVDVGGIAYNGNTLHLIDYSEGLSATEYNRCFVYVFDEHRALAFPDADYTGVTARLVRTFYADGWNTLRLPFHDTTKNFLSIFGSGAVLSEFTGLEKDTNSNTLLMRFSDSNATTPGIYKNLLLKLDLAEDLVNPKFEKVTIDPVSEAEDKSASITLNGETYTVTYRGVNEPTQIAANDGTKLFLGSAGNELVYASVTNNLRATRCYFDLSFDVLAADAAINTAFFEVGGEEVTSIDGVPVMEAKQGAVYTVQGQYVGERLQNLPKGIYIVNGKKMVIK